MNPPFPRLQGPLVPKNEPAHTREATKTELPSVVGFLFDDPITSVVLIRKNRPEHLKGMLNGPGGKIENGETPDIAMAREFHEETGLWIPPLAWREFARITYEDTDREVICFESKVGVRTALKDLIRTITDEAVYVRSPFALLALPVVPSLHWLIPLALDTNKTAHIIRHDDIKR